MAALAACATTTKVGRAEGAASPPLPAEALPAAVPARVTVSYPASDPAAADRAAAVARLLREKGVAVSGPTPAAAAPGVPSGISYFFVEDGEAAAAVGRALGGSLGEARLAAPEDAQTRPRPGTVIVLVAGSSWGVELAQKALPNQQHNTVQPCSTQNP